MGVGVVGFLGVIYVLVILLFIIKLWLLIKLLLLLVKNRIVCVCLMVFLNLLVGKCIFFLCFLVLLLFN